MSITIADTSRIDANSENVDLLLTEIGYYMGWDGLDEVFVSDLSMISDFLLDDDELLAIAEKLDVAIDQEDYIWEVAERMN